MKEQVERMFIGAETDIRYGRADGKRWLVCGGTVCSKNDGQYHKITPRQLVILYRVKPSECVLLEDGGSLPLGLDVTGLVELHPSYDGNYALPGN